LSGISNFGITANSNIAKLVFSDLEIFTNDAGNKYIFNPNAAGNIDLLLFENCILHDMRGVTRYRGGMKVEQQVFSNCILFNIQNYAVLTVDDNKSSVNNFTFENSTLYNADVFIVNKNNASGNYKILHSTFYRGPQSGRNFIDFNTNTISGGLEIRGIIFAEPKASSGATTPYSLTGVKVNPTTQISSGGNYHTKDFAWKESSDAIVPSTIEYTKISTDLFTDPAAGNFRIKDNGFAGKDDAGDPRWRP
jgi:hypothetical protein